MGKTVNNVIYSSCPSLGGFFDEDHIFVDYQGGQLGANTSYRNFAQKKFNFFEYYNLNDIF